MWPSHSVGSGVKGQRAEQQRKWVWPTRNPLVVDALKRAELFGESSIHCQPQLLAVQRAHNAHTLGV